MKINNPVDTRSGGDGKFIDSREIKKQDAKTGIKVRLYGDAEMGYSYYQNTDEGKIRVVRSADVPEMVDQTDGYQGAEQKPGKNLYIIAWNYETKAPAILNLDKVGLINGVLSINDDKDLKSATDYDLKMTFNDDAAPQDKYKVVRLDASKLNAKQTKDLKAFAAKVDLEAYADGGDIEDF